MLVFILPSCLFLVALWSPAGMGWSLVCGAFSRFSCVFVALLCGVPGPVWWLVVLISDLYLLLYFEY